MDHRHDVGLDPETHIGRTVVDEHHHLLDKVALLVVGVERHGDLGCLARTHGTLGIVGDHAATPRVDCRDGHGTLAVVAQTEDMDHLTVFLVDGTEVVGALYGLERLKKLWFALCLCRKCREE